jgi:hypothetical protein
MRRIGPGLALLALAAVLAACSGGDDSDVAQTVAEGDRWAGPPQAGSDGRLAVGQFNEHLDEADAPWTRSPVLAAAEFVRLDESEATKTSVVATSRKEGATTRVIVTLNGLTDDSVQGARYVLNFERAEDGKIRLESARWSQRCARGRGHRDFKPGDCA